MTIRMKKMWQLAIKEAVKLKKHATKKEISKLDISDFNPDSESRCIYGLMTGHCESERANELILKCCERVYSNTNSPSRANNKLNGAPTKQIEYSRLSQYTSPIETLIFPRNCGKEAGIRIIRFLKGETRTLTIPK